jgi:site-specific DNA-cytosine methylase
MIDNIVERVVSLFRSRSQRGIEKYGTKGEISDSQRYKMCGNAVTVDVVAEVAKRIKLVI